MHLNDLSPAEGSTHYPKRRGRGIGSGLGKTGGVGVKGQKSRGKGKVRPGFEGGQMPLYRRLPKFGFTSLKQQVTAEVRLSEINFVDGDEVTLESLKACNVVRNDMTRARVILSGEVARALTVKGVTVTKGARAAIEAAGGKVEE
ncbi:MAG: 50S ribosomal protein L15 [Paraperlucidibaca sp.]